MNNVKKGKISDLINDVNNLNKGSEYGGHLLEKSVEEFGLGRGIVVDVNNNIIGGNHITETALAKGFTDVVFVETTGNTLVVTKRIDVDKTTPEGLQKATVMGLADNQTQKINYVFDAEVSDAILTEAICEEWGVKNYDKDIDYDLLDDEDNQLLEDLQKNVKKAIQIEFEVEHFEEAQLLVKFWRGQKLYIGKYLLDKLKEEKAKL